MEKVNQETAHAKGKINLLEMAISSCLTIAKECEQWHIMKNLMEVISII